MGGSPGKGPGNPDWDMKNLVKIYDEIRIVNKCFSERLGDINIEDASVNAVVLLDAFADFITFSITENMLDEIKLLFSSYFE